MYLEVLSRQPASNPRPTPLLFVHGASHGAWYWTNFLDYFAEHGYTAYAPNLRGHGASAAPGATLVGDFETAERARVGLWRLDESGLVGAPRATLEEVVLGYLAASRSHESATGEAA